MSAPPTPRDGGLEVGHWDPANGPLTEGGLRRLLESWGFEVFVYVYRPGTVFPPHTHSVHKIDAILSGRFRLSAAGRSVELSAGDWVVVPKGIVHTAEVVGDEPVVSLDATRRP